MKRSAQFLYLPASPPQKGSKIRERKTEGRTNEREAEPGAEPVKEKTTSEERARSPVSSAGD